MLDQSAKAVLRDVLMSLQEPNKATFDTRYYGVYTRGKGKGKMVAGVKSASQNEILPYSVELNSKDGVLIRAVDMTKVRDRLATSLAKPQFKQLYGNPADALKDFNRYLENITQINPIDSATLLGGGEKGAKKRNLFYETLGFRLRNGESLVNAPESIINKSQDTIKSYRAERFAKLQRSGHAFAFEEATTYERAMRNFQPDAFTRETLPAGETLTNPDGYRILKKVGSTLFRVYDDKGELIGTASKELDVMRKAQADFAKKAVKEEKRFQPVTPDRDAAYLNAVKAGDTAKSQRMVDEVAKKSRLIKVWRKGSVTKPGEGGFHFGTKNQADSIEDRNAKSNEYYIKVSNPVRLVDYSDWSDSGLESQGYDLQENAPIIYLNRHEGLGDSGAVDIDGNPLTSSEQDALTDAEFLNANPSAKDSFIIRDSSAIKSADPVTYDDAGNVIPLSQRFNSSSPDIRFQPDPASPNILVNSEGNRIIKSASGKYRVYNAAGALLGVRETEESAIKLATK